jgi:hypothetical protein
MLAISAIKPHQEGLLYLIGDGIRQHAMCIGQNHPVEKGCSNFSIETLTYSRALCATKATLGWSRMQSAI